MKTKTFLLALLALLLSLAACSPAGGDQGSTEPTVSPTETPVEQPTETPEKPAVPDGLLGAWYWLAFEDSADGEESHDITVADPSKYTLEFMADGTVQIRADCNSATSMVTIDGNALTFAPGPMTLAECEPGSLYSEYLARLSDVVTFTFGAGGDLVLNLKMDAGNMIFASEPTPLIPADLVSQVWYWLAFEDSADGAESNDITVLDPTKYTLELLPDGTYIVAADCNRSGGGYNADGSSLTLLPGPTTLAECEPGSLYDVFLARLGDVVTYVFDEDSNLVLNLRMDAGNMIFGREGSSLAELEGTSWTLVGQGSTDDLAPPLPDTEITIDFKDGQVAGSAGCNRYFADYTVKAEGKLQIGQAGSTMMACPEEVMQQEFAYLGALAAAESYTLEGGALTIHSGEGDLVFEAAQDLALEGQVWMLSGIVQDEAVVSTAIDSTITAEFSGEQVTGSAGCNSYFADYETEGSSLNLGLVGSTMMTCDDETNQREAEFLSALESVAGYEISRKTLTLTDADGNALLFFQAQGDA